MRTIAKEFLSSITSPDVSFSEVLKQLNKITWQALPTTLSAGLFVGAILALQFGAQLEPFGAESVLGGLNTSGTLREVGPVLIAFMLAGRVGAFTAAELGSMRATEQIDALKSLGINTMAYLVVPRFFAVLFASSLLLIFGLVVSILGGLGAAFFAFGINSQQYFSAVPRFATGDAVAIAFVKSVIFGFLMAAIACKHGYSAKGGSAGVGEAVRRTALWSMVAIVSADFVMGLILRGLTAL